MRITNIQIGATYLIITLKYVFKTLFLSIPISLGNMFLLIHHPAKTQVIIATIGIKMLFAKKSNALKISLPKIVRSLKSPNPSEDKVPNTIIAPKTIRQAVSLFIFPFSVRTATIASTRETELVTAAKSTKTKKTVAIILPKGAGIALKTFVS